MLELPDKMQVTLVAFHGEKPNELVQLITFLQDTLATAFWSAFRPYVLEQVHGTIIGLEGHRVGGTVQNSMSGLQVDPTLLLNFIKSNAFPSIQIRIGGYRNFEQYPFRSRGMHPYIRSFSIQGDIAVAMGWPVDHSNSIDDVRWEFASRFGVQHKYHKEKSDRDNDFFFVLGRVDRRRVDTVRLQSVAEQIRLSLAGLDYVVATIDSNSLRLVAYLDPQLPVETSCSFRVDDAELTPTRFLGLYEPVRTSV